MGWETEYSVDEQEQRGVSGERLVAQVRASQLRSLEVLDRTQVFTADGSRNLSEWLAARTDIGSDTARSVVQTMRRTQNKPWLREALEVGAISFDRMAALSKIDENVGLLEHLDIAGVRREAADRVEITIDDEIRGADEQFLVMQPSLDESWWTVFGGLDGVVGTAVDNALTTLADEVRLEAGPRVGAQALSAIFCDSVT